MSGRNCDLPHSSHLTVIARQPFTSTLQVKRQPSSSPIWPVAALVIKSVSSWSPMKQQDVTLQMGLPLFTYDDKMKKTAEKRGIKCL